MTTSNITLSFVQAKTVIENLGRDTLETFINDMNDQPKFLLNMGEIDSLEELASIRQGGCASGAYMPAVTYYTALKCMSECSESVEDQIEHYEEVIYNVAQDTFASFCSTLCAMAVESWVMQFDEILDCLESNDCLYV